MDRSRHRSDDRPRVTSGLRTRRRIRPLGAGPGRRRGDLRSRPGVPGVGARPTGAPGHLSILAVPIFAAGEWWGFVGYDQCEDERDWQPAEIEALSLVANTLGAAIGRERAMRTLSETEARYQTPHRADPRRHLHGVGGRAGQEALHQSPGGDDPRVRPGRVEPRGLARAIHPDDRDRVLAEDSGRRRRANRSAASTAWCGRTRDRLAPGRRRAAAGRPRRTALLAGCAVRHHRVEGSRGAPPRGGATLPDAGRADPGDHVHRRGRSSDEVGPWRTIYISPQVETILGYTPEEWSDDDALWEGIIHPDDEPPRSRRTASTTSR